MKKIFLFLLIFNFAFADVNYKLCENNVNEILNYSLKFDSSFYNPFYVPHKKIVIRKVQIIKPKPKLKILAILDDRVLLNSNSMGRNQKKWLKIGESMENFKLIKITKNSVLFEHNNKIEVLPVNIKINLFKLKVSK